MTTADRNRESFLYGTDSQRAYDRGFRDARRDEPRARYADRALQRAYNSGYEDGSFTMEEGL
jgi:hypothetical protein